MRRIVCFSMIICWLLCVWEAGKWFNLVPTAVAQNGCPNLDVDCPSDCNYACDPYGSPVQRCTEIESYPNITWLSLLVPDVSLPQERHVPRAVVRFGTILDTSIGNYGEVCLPLRSGLGM